MASLRRTNRRGSCTLYISPERIIRDYDEHSISLVSSPLYHAAPAHMALTGHAFGGTVVMMPKFDAEDALRVIEKYKNYSWAMGTNSIYENV